MTALRLTARRSLCAVRPVATNGRLTNVSASNSNWLTFDTHRYASQGYGDAKGDPVASDPQNQPANTQATESAEHPGPTPPNAQGGQKTKKNPEDASAESGGSRSKDAVEKGASPTAGRVGKED